MDFFKPLEWDDEEGLFTLFVSYIPYYGAFNVKQTIIELSQHPDSKRSVYIAIGQTKIITDFTSRLVDYGYAIRRYDIEMVHLQYIELTEKGRELKRAGSIEAYSILCDQEKQERLRDKRRISQTYWIQFWIALGAIVTSLYYVMDFLLRYQKIKYRPSFVGTLAHISFFLFGIIAGIIIYMLILEGLNRKRKSKQ